MSTKKLPLLLLLLFILYSCNEENNTPTDPTTIAAGEGVLIFNEGQFGNGNASVSYYNFATEQVTTTLFAQANDRPLGDVLQSARLLDQQLWLVVNASQKIEIVDLPDFTANRTIVGLTSPRFFQPISADKAYVTDLFADAISVLDLAANTIDKTIPLPNWTEEMIQVGNQIFVSAPWFFGTTPSNQVWVLDATTDAIVNQIEVGIDPGAMVLDGAGKIWVFCKGNATDNTFGGLYRIDPATQVVEREFSFSDFDLTFAPRLALDPNLEVLYYVKGDVFELPIEAEALPANPLIPSDGRSIYALGVDPNTGHIFVGDAVDFQQNGQIFEYDASGQEVGRFTAGVGPNGFLFY
ncbi:MAG: YncE family protein [Bacteroidota bacterium]